MEFNFKISQDKLLLIGRDRALSGSLNYYGCRFQFSEEWAGLAKLAVFEQEGICYGPCAILEGCCRIPAEVLKAKQSFRVGVYGTANEPEELRITTNWQTISVGEGAYSADAAEPAVPDADLWEQYLAVMQKAVNHAVPVIGQNGNWYVWDAQAEQYTDTQKQAKGDPGEQGPKGAQGEPGYTPVKGIDYFTEADIDALGLENKVDKVDGKGLSSNDFTDREKSSIHTHANQAELDGIRGPEISRWEKASAGYALFVEMTLEQDVYDISFKKTDSGWELLPQLSDVYISLDIPKSSGNDSLRILFNGTAVVHNARTITDTEAKVMKVWLTKQCVWFGFITMGVNEAQSTSFNTMSGRLSQDIDNIRFFTTAAPIPRGTKIKIYGKAGTK